MGIEMYWIGVVAAIINIFAVYEMSKDDDLLDDESIMGAFLSIFLSWVYIAVLVIIFVIAIIELYIAER